MQSQKRETRKRMGPTPVVASPVEDIVPEGAPISDDDSVVSSVYSVHSEPEGEFWDDLDNHVPGPPPQLLIYMRELGRMSFLRETTRYRLLRELQYHLLLIFGVATSAGIPKGQLSGLISRYKIDMEDGAFASFLSEFEGLLK